MEFIARYISVAAVDYLGLGTTGWQPLLIGAEVAVTTVDRPAMHDVCGRRRGQVFSRGTGSAAPLDHM